MNRQKRQKWSGKREEILAYLERRLPKQILGNREDWRIRLYKQYGNAYSAAEIETILDQERRKLLSRYLTVIAAGVLFIFLWLGTQNTPDLASLLKRPPYGQPVVRRQLTAQMHYGDLNIEQKRDVAVNAKKLTSREAKRRFADLQKRLPEIVKGEKDSPKNAAAQLILPARDEKTGITLRWFTEDTKRISADGSLDLIGLSASERILLRAELALGKWKKEIEIPIDLLPAEKNADLEAGLRTRLAEAVEKAENEQNTGSLALPSDLGDGVRVTWSVSKTESPAKAILIFTAGLCLLLYRNRYRTIDAEGKSRRAAMRREFPELVNQLVLLLNAGLVVSAALEEIADSAELTEESRCKSPLFYEIGQIGRRTASSNASFIRELKDFSHACGIREMIRFSAIVEDNMDKGSSLADKLEQEAHLLRDQQKKNAEEQGRIAETKLSLPLVILLLVLITIATAPVLFEI